MFIQTTLLVLGVVDEEQQSPEKDRISAISQRLSAIFFLLPKGERPKEPYTSSLPELFDADIGIRFRGMSQLIWGYCNSLYDLNREYEVAYVLFGEIAACGRLMHEYEEAAAIDPDLARFVAVLQSISDKAFDDLDIRVDKAALTSFFSRRENLDWKALYWALETITKPVP